MLFNSLEFGVFLPIVFLLYWLVAKGHLKAQNSLLLVASYFFYASWDWRFLFLLIFSTLLDYFSGIKIANSGSTRQKRIWLWLSIGINLGFLGVFKYYNFFVDSFQDTIGVFGLQMDLWLLSVILPVGISFYTFHGLSYVIDIYYGRIQPERDLVVYSLFVSFFPLLVAGPIERATHLLPQLKTARSFNYAKAVDGLRQILWGLFKKIVIADNCAPYVNSVFNNYDSSSGSTLLLASVLFAIQIYCDFSGYSDIALGTARLLGIELLRNFAFPYFSRDIAEFWRRWHISLTTWFRDYVYIPLGGSRGSKWLQVRNTFIVFLLSGLWHGANWTFVIWGALNALYFLPLLLSGKNRNHLGPVAEDRILPNLKELTGITLTFGLTVFAWIFFRSESVGQAIVILQNIFSSSIVSLPEATSVFLIPVILFFIGIEWIGRNDSYAIKSLFFSRGRMVRWTFYYSVAMVIFLFAGKEQQFIYFQF